jgi:hypothetical protein
MKFGLPDYILYVIVKELTFLFCHQRRNVTFKVGPFLSLLSGDEDQAFFSSSPYFPITALMAR